MKTKIIRIAMRLFARRGFAATSMREIAEETQLTKASLYYHFPDKETLYREAMRETHELLLRRIQAGGENEEDPIRRLQGVVHAYLQVFVDEADLIRSLYHNLLEPSHVPAVVLGPDDATFPLREAMAVCRKAGLVPADRFEERFTLLLGGIEISGVRWLLDPRAPRPGPRLGDRLLEAALPELRGRLPRRRRPPSQGGAAATPQTGAASAVRRSVRRQASPAVIGSGRPLPRRGNRRADGRDAGTRGRRPGGRRVDLILALAIVAGAAAEVPAQEAPVSGTLPGDSEFRTIETIPGAAEVLSLADCVEQALESNAALQAVRREMGELDGQMWQATATGMPRVDLVGNWTRSRDPSFALDATFGGGSGGSGFDSLFGGLIPDAAGIPPQSFWRASADATWEINPILVMNAVGAAELGIDRQESMILAAEQGTTEETLIAYYDVFRAAERVAAAEAQSTARAEFLGITRRRFHLDLATGLDTLQAAVGLANVLPDLRRAQQELRNAGSRLNVLMGRPALEPLTIGDRIEIDEGRVSEAAAVRLAQDRPEIRQLVLLEEIYGKNRGAQRAQHLPYLSLFGSYGYVAREVGGLGERGLDTWTASVSLTLPVFDGFLTRGRMRESEATIQKTRLQREEAARQARLEVLTLRGELEVARENLAASRLNLIQAEDALRTTTLLYENAKADYLAVLNAEADRQTARRVLIDARYEVLSLTASLKRAMGISPLISLNLIERMGTVTEEGSKP